MVVQVLSEGMTFEQRPEECMREVYYRHRRQPVQRPWGRNELGVSYLWQGSQGGKGYTKFPNFSKYTEPLTGGNGGGGGGGMSSSLSSFSGKTWCQGRAVNLDLSQKTMGPRNQWSVGLKVNGQRAGARADHVEFVNRSGLKKNFPVRGRSFWPASKRRLLWCLRADMENEDLLPS